MQNNVPWGKMVIVSLLGAEEYNKGCYVRRGYRDCALCTEGPRFNTWHLQLEEGSQVVGTASPEILESHFQLNLKVMDEFSMIYYEC